MIMGKIYGQHPAGRPGAVFWCARRAHVLRGESPRPARQWERGRYKWERTSEYLGRRYFQMKTCSMDRDGDFRYTKFQTKEFGVKHRTFTRREGGRI